MYLGSVYYVPLNILVKKEETDSVGRMEETQDCKLEIWGLILTVVWVWLASLWIFLGLSLFVDQVKRLTDWDF